MADFDAPAGRGVLGTVEDHTVTLGTKSFLTNRGIDTAALDANADADRLRGTAPRSST